MSQIDWNKAPDWAQVVIRGGYGQLFWSPAWGGVHTVENLISGHVQYADMVKPHDWVKVDERPMKPWTGEGQPPVGTVCEVDGTSGPDGWSKCIVKYSSQDVIVFSRVDSDVEHAKYSGEANFRPIRTPEQIAAERKGREITDMLNIVNDPGLKGKGVTQQLEALYDAGFQRKVAE